MIQLKNITVNAGTKQLLTDVSTRCYANQFSWIIGPNGAGKSTLLQVISGLRTPDRGEVTIEGRPIADFSGPELAQKRAVLSQQAELAFPLKVHEVVMMGRYPHFNQQPTKLDHLICEKVMQLVDCYDFAQRNFLTLSGGEKQRVQFARVIAQLWQEEPTTKRYLLLDEPLTFLDIYHQLDFLKQLEQLIRAQNITVIGVLHDLNLVARYGNHILLLHQGQVLAQGSSHEVFTQEHIQTAFRVSPTIHMDNNSIFLRF